MASAALLAAAFRSLRMEWWSAAAGWVTAVGTAAALTGLQQCQAMAKRAVVAVTGGDWRSAAGCGVPDHFAKNDGAPHIWYILHTPLSVYSMAKLQRVFD